MYVVTADWKLLAQLSLPAYCHLMILFVHLIDLLMQLVIGSQLAPETAAL